MNKEEIYDNQIAPLMAQVIEICQTHSIAMLASFCIPTEAEPGLTCTTALIGGRYGDYPELKSAHHLILNGNRDFAAFVITEESK